MWEAWWRRLPSKTETHPRVWRFKGRSTLGLLPHSTLKMWLGLGEGPEDPRESRVQACQGLLLPELPERGDSGRWPGEPYGQSNMASARLDKALQPLLLGAA